MTTTTYTAIKEANLALAAASQEYADASAAYYGPGYPSDRDWERLDAARRRLAAAWLRYDAEADNASRRF